MSKSADKAIQRMALAFMAAFLTMGVSRAQSPTATPDVRYVEQGWKPADRETFYTTVQGSHIMPYAWFKALRRLDTDAPFSDDQLSRYGYIHNDSPANTEGLPIGFVIDGTPTQGQIGMTCAACHTGQLEYQKDGATHAIRLDGAPAAAADFQQFLTDLKDTSRATLEQPDRFTAFAQRVLGSGSSAAKVAQLKTLLAAWVQQFGDFMTASLPPSPWGPGRLDAFGMIFNRVTARDLGVAGNFKVADAPVSYPFLWNAHRQDHTQWNGGVPNGLFITALARNSGEVFGVFADFKPSVRTPAVGLVPKIINYRANSVQYSGLQTLEEKIAALKPPPWPKDTFPIDADMANKGKALFDTNCGGCHNEKPSKTAPHAWDTPIKPVGTDPKMAINAELTSDPGLYTGSPLPPPSIGATFANPATNVEILASSVVGGLLDGAFDPATLMLPDRTTRNGVLRALDMDLHSLVPGEKVEDLTKPSGSHLAELKALIKSRLGHLYKNESPAADGAAYESRVLYGIWATAPYLHNGSVPNLWQLLTPPAQRTTSFNVGSRLFDPKNVGFSTESSPSKNGRFAVDPEKGNGNGGHDYGTGLTDDERWQIIEYMKTL
jgi:hypothetical protein